MQGKLGTRFLSDTRVEHGSLWAKIAEAAENQLCDASGLSPWWLVEGAGVTRYIFDLPHGRDALRFERLREQRLIYRLALGQPNQEDFLNMLARSNPERIKIYRTLALDLSAFNRFLWTQNSSVWGGAGDQRDNLNQELNESRRWA